MGVIGDGNGIPSENSRVTRTEPIVTVDKLKTNYLFGLAFQDANGNELPKSAFEQYIRNATSLLEHKLDIAITPIKGYEENRDYRLNEYAEWGFFELSNYPAICINKIELIYIRDNDGVAEIAQEIPKSWIRFQEHDGLIRLMPNARFPANLQVSQSGSFFPEVLRTSMAPHLWRINYDYGFADGKIPVLVNEAISRIAAMQALIIGGALVIGAGIASSSVSLDGLSQSINTTASAENSNYSAQFKEHQDLVFGKTKDSPFAILPLLLHYYKGSDFTFI